MSIFGLAYPILNSDRPYLLSEGDMEALLSSHELIHLCWDLQKSLESVQQALLELELEMAEYCIQSCIQPNLDVTFLDVRPRLERRVLALLSSIRAYHDHANKALKGSSRNECFKECRAAYSAAFDKSFEYRLIEKIRNIAQHSTSPISTISFSHRGRGESFEISIDILASREHLLSHRDHLKAKLASEIEDGGFEVFDLKHCLRVYVGLLAEANDAARDVIVGSGSPLDCLQHLQEAVSAESGMDIEKCREISLNGVPSGENTLEGIDIEELRRMWSSSQGRNAYCGVGKTYYSSAINGHPNGYPPKIIRKQKP